MKKILVRSVDETYEYVMAHYYPNGMREFCERTDSYAVISIQDAHCGGFGIEFRENEFCKKVLTLYFDDVYREVEGAVSFSDDMAEKVISFLGEVKDIADTLIIHCYAGQSRSKAVGIFANEYYGFNQKNLSKEQNFNELVYSKLRNCCDNAKK